MSNITAGEHHDASDATMIAEIVQVLEPMGDLSRFAIEDLTPEEEDGSSGSSRATSHRRLSSTR